jgi:hypothetical protein
MLNTSASPAVYLHSTRAGWKTIGTYARMRRGPQSREDHTLIQRLQKFWPTHANAPADPFAASNGKTWRHEGITIRLQAAVNPEEMSRLCSRMAASPVYGMIRDADFFRWRFANPARTYYFLIAEQNGNLEAYLALSVRLVEGGLDVRIVDWGTLDPAQFPRLLQALARFAPEVRVNILVTACSETERRDLVAAGFHEITADPPVERFAGVLGIPTAAESPDFERLQREGFATLEFKGIESDGA